MLGEVEGIKNVKFGMFCRVATVAWGDRGFASFAFRLLLLDVIGEFAQGLGGTFPSEAHRVIVVLCIPIPLFAAHGRSACVRLQSLLIVFTGYAARRIVENRNYPVFE